MVQPYKKEDFFSLFEYVKNNLDDDFYITNNNLRLPIKDKNSLKIFIKESKNIMIIYDRGDVMGVIGLWKSIGNGICRFYVKQNSCNEKIADQLLTVFLWNNDKDLYLKIKKSSKFYKVFRNKQFNFKGDRGSQTLLVYSKSNLSYNKINHREKEKENVSFDNKIKN
jgi:hypothetical protein